MPYTPPGTDPTGNPHPPPPPAEPAVKKPVPPAAPAAPPPPREITDKEIKDYQARKGHA